MSLGLAYRSCNRGKECSATTRRRCAAPPAPSRTRRGGRSSSGSPKSAMFRRARNDEGRTRCRTSGSTTSSRGKSERPVIFGAHPTDEDERPGCSAMSGTKTRTGSSRASRRSAATRTCWPGGRLHRALEGAGGLTSLTTSPTLTNDDVTASWPGGGTGTRQPIRLGQRLVRGHLVTRGDTGCHVSSRCGH